MFQKMTFFMLALVSMTSCKKSTGASSPQEQHVGFTATVNYEAPDFETLRHSFDWVNEEFRKAQPNMSQEKAPKQIVFEYVVYHRGTSVEQVLDEFNRRGLRPATYLELLAFAHTFPDEQRRHMIFALGSVVAIAGEPCNPMVKGDATMRYLNLNRINQEWLEDDHFLAVPK